MSWRKRKRVHLVEEGETQGRTAEIYAELRDALGISYVPEVYRAWASFPEFLHLHWEAFRPVLHTQEFFSLAERLRADAYTRGHNYFAVPAMEQELRRLGFSQGALQELHQTIELFHYVNPAMLLIVAAQWQALEKPVGSDARPTQPAVRPVYDLRPLALDEATAPAPIRKIFDEMRRDLDLPHVDFKLRALARWPDFLRLYWNVLRPAAALPVYPAAHTGLRETAFALTRELPLVVEISDEQLRDAGMEAEDIAGAARITELYLKNTAAMGLNLAIAKIALEGGNQLAPSEARKEPEAAKPESRRGVA